MSGKAKHVGQSKACEAHEARRQSYLVIVRMMHQQASRMSLNGLMVLDPSQKVRMYTPSGHPAS
jgi:hypothetical protein